MLKSLAPTKLAGLKVPKDLDRPDLDRARVLPKLKMPKLRTKPAVRLKVL